MNICTTVEQPAETTYDHQFNFLGLPAELQLTVYRLIADSTFWDLAVRMIKTEGPDTSEDEIPEPVVVLCRSPPYRNTSARSAFAQTCRQLYNLTRQTRLDPWMGYTGRLVIQDPDMYDKRSEFEWFDDLVQPFLESGIPDWVRERTKIMGLPSIFYDQQCEHWWDIAAIARKNFYNAQALEILGENLYSKSRVGIPWLSWGCVIDEDIVARDMKHVVKTTCNDNTGFRQRLMESSMQLCLSCVLKRDESIPDYAFEGKVKWVRDTVSRFLMGQALLTLQYAFGGFDDEGQIVATVEQIDAWVI